MSCSSSIRRHAWSRCVLATALLAAAFVAGPRAVLSADQTKPRFQIKFATLAPEGSTWMKTMHEIDVEVRRRTDNRLGFKFYPGAVQEFGWPFECAARFPRHEGIQGDPGYRPRSRSAHRNQSGRPDPLFASGRSQTCCGQHSTGGVVFQQES